jgi:microcystin-dependent protein
MTQASDLGQIINQSGSLYRARVNTNLQALATCHYAASAPDPAYPNLLWFDSGTGQVWLRDPSNAAWNAVATIGPPFKWTAIDVPATGFTTGDIKLTVKSSADSGWVLMNDGSIGNASSSATARANADTSDLFTLLWTNVSNTWCPVQDASGTPVSRGASAASDFAANRRLVLPKTLGRALAIAGWGSGLTSRALGEVQGEETHLLTSSEMPAHTHAPGTLAASGGAHSHTLPTYTSDGGTTVLGTAATYAVGAALSTNSASHTHAFSGATASTGGGSSHNNMQPTSFLNVMIKL